MRIAVVGDVKITFAGQSFERFVDLPALGDVPNVGSAGIRGPFTVRFKLKRNAKARKAVWFLRRLFRPPRHERTAKDARQRAYARRALSMARRRMHVFRRRGWLE